eukprot:755938-Hanusia_phi.AAC.4
MSNYAALLGCMDSEGMAVPEDPQEVFDRRDGGKTIHNMSDRTHRVLKVDPTHLEAICNNALYLRDQVPERCFERLLMVEAQKNDIEGATFLLEKAIQANPDNHVIYHPLVQCYLKARVSLLVPMLWSGLGEETETLARITRQQRKLFCTP